MIRRLAVLGLLVTALFGLAVWYGSTPADPRMGRFPTTGDLVTGYDEHVGDRVVVTGRVVETDPVVLHASVADRTLSLRIEALDRPVSRGDRIQVFGVVAPDARIRSINAVDAGGRAYAWSVSLVAGLLVLARGVRQWRVDRETGSVRVDGGDRDDG